MAGRVLQIYIRDISKSGSCSNLYSFGSKDTPGILMSLTLTRTSFTNEDSLVLQNFYLRVVTGFTSRWYTIQPCPWNLFCSCFATRLMCVEGQAKDVF